MSTTIRKSAMNSIKNCNKNYNKKSINWLVSTAINQVLE